MSDTINVKNLENNTTAEVVHKALFDGTPLVSIIIPVYNRELYLRECMDSAVGQTYKNIEIICVDDGSSDSSMDILKEYADENNRITILIQNNSGAAIARNAGIAIARGDYLWFADSDDVLDINACKKFADYINKNTDVDIVILNTMDFKNVKDDIEYTRMNIGDMPKENPFSPIKYSSMLNKFTSPEPWNKIFSRKFINDKKLRFQNLASCNDVYFSFCSLSLAGKIGYITDICYYYRLMAEGSIMTKKNNISAINIVEAYKQIRINLISHNKFDIYKNLYYKWFCGNIRYELRFLPARKKAKLLANAYSILGVKQGTMLIITVISRKSKSILRKVLENTPIYNLYKKHKTQKGKIK